MKLMDLGQTFVIFMFILGEIWKKDSADFMKKEIFYLQLSYADIALYFNSTWPAFVKVDF